MCCKLCHFFRIVSLGDERSRVNAGARAAGVLFFNRSYQTVFTVQTQLIVVMLLLPVLSLCSSTGMIPTVSCHTRNAMSRLTYGPIEFGSIVQVALNSGTDRLGGMRRL